VLFGCQLSSGRDNVVIQIESRAHGLMLAHQRIKRCECTFERRDTPESHRILKFVRLSP
jgi:hypothetical protein